MVDTPVALTPQACRLPARDARDSGNGASGWRCRLAADVRSASPLGTSVRTRFAGEASRELRGDGGSVRRILAYPASRGEGGHSRAGCPGPTGIPAPGTVAPARGLCAPGTAHGRAPLASGCRGDAGEERSRAQVPGSGVLLRKAARDGPVIRAAGVSQPRRCRVRRRQERCDRRRSAAAAYAPGRRTTGTGLCVVDRMPARAHARSSRASVLSAGRVTVGHCTPGV